MAEPATKTIQVNDLPRINEISLVLAKNGFGHLLNLVGIAAVLPAGTDKATGSFARRLRQVLVDLGPTFVKLGQVLSVRPDILPQDVLTEFESLQDRVPAMAMEDVQWVVEQELQRPIEEVFEWFDPVPLGSASIAQVHRAKLLPTETEPGREVAVKLQRRGIERTIRSDISILYSLATVAEGRISLPGLHTPRAIVREFDLAISRELDFLLEMESLDRMARHLEAAGAGKGGLDIAVPKVHHEWTSRRMLVMELVEGTSLHQRIAEIEPGGPEASRLAHLVMEATYRMVFDFGFFHGDPHPGNLMVAADGRLFYLDFGMVGTLTGAMQETIINAFTSMVFRDAQTLAMTVYRAGATRGRVDIKAFVDELERKMQQYYGASLDDLANTTTFMEVVEMCTRFQISLPPEFAVLSRAITLVEGEIRALLPGIDIVEEVRPYAQRLIARRFSPERVAQDAARMMIQAQGHFRDLPTQVNQMMMDLQGGNVQLITRDPDAGRLREEIRAAVLRLSLAAAASTVTMGSMLFLAAASLAPFGFAQVLAILAGMGGMLLGGSLFGALGIHVFFARFLSIGYWQRLFLGVFRFLRWRR
ncbi:MAG: AarF/UbiB family protein [Myxococcota bacterium]